MAHHLNKFLQMEKEPVSPQPAVANKPKRRKDLNIFGHIAKQFENPDGVKEQRKKQIEERKEAMRREKELKEQEVRDKKQREIQEAEEKKRKQEEEEERIRIEEEKKRLAEDAEKKRQERQKLREEEELLSKTTRLNPAQERFERCRNIRMRASKPVTSERIVVNAGAISELRGKLFQNKKNNEVEFQKKAKPPSRKLIIPPSKTEESKSVEIPEKKVSVEKAPTELLSTMDTIKDQQKPELNSSSLINTKEHLIYDEQVTLLEPNQHATSRRGSKIDERRGSRVSLNKDGIKPKTTKRQSFISDFASLEKTYKLLGISKDKDPPPVNPTKIRHKSAEKVKTKDKMKKHKSLNIEQELASTVKAKTPELEEEVQTKPAINILEKGKSANLKNFFQSVISEKKNTKPLELMGPQKLKRGSMQHVFERQSSSPNTTLERQIERPGVIDKKKFENFLDKFEPQQQREIAKLKVAQITAQQKEFEKQKKITEEKRLQEEAEETRLQQETAMAVQEEIRKRNEEEIQEELAKQQIEVDKNKRDKEYNEVPLKLKPKKKKTKKSSKKNILTQEEEVKNLPSILASHTYDNMKSKFEKKRINELSPSSSTNITKVNKLKNNPFLATLEKSATLETPSGLGDNQNGTDQPNKLSKDKFLKFESKKLQNKNTFEGNMEGEKTQIQLDRQILQTPLNKEKVQEFYLNTEKVSDRNSKEGPQEEKASEQKSKEGKISKRNSTESKLSKRNSSEKKKSFMEDSRNFIRTSAEKLFKMSKEALNEIENKIDERPSIGEMQNYLLSHVLFDGKEIVKKSKEEIEKEDVLYDTEYKRDMEKYLALFDEEKPKIEKLKPLPQIKTVEVKSIGEQLKKQFQKTNEKPIIDEDLSHCDKKVNKIRNDLFSKFDVSEQCNKNGKENIKDENVETNLVEDNKKGPTVKSKVFDRVQLIMDRFSDLEEKQILTEKKPLEVVSHQSFSNVLLKVKTKLENQEEAKCETTNQNSIETNKFNESEWSWKKKENMPMEDETKKTIEKERKLSKRENQDIKRDELLEDLHLVSNRLKKKEDADKDNERKTKEMDEFMNDIENYLQSPNNSIEEKEFKEDIQEYITIQKTKPKASKKKTKTKKENNALPDLNIRKLKDIKLQLLATEEKTNTTIEKSDISVSKLRRDLLQKEDVEYQERKENSNISRTAISEMKNVFENRDEEIQVPKDSKKIKRTLIKAPEMTTDPKPTKNISQEWKYKKKSILELQTLINKNVTLAPKSVKDMATVVQTNIRRYSCHEGEINEKEEIDDYAHFMKTVNDFLKAPDRNEIECSFKVEIEKYLDLIEDSDEEVFYGQDRFEEPMTSEKEYTNLMDDFDAPLMIPLNNESEEIDIKIDLENEEEIKRQIEKERKNSLIIQRREDQEREFAEFLSEVDDLLGKDNIVDNDSKTEFESFLEVDMEKIPKKVKAKCKKGDKKLPEIKLLNLDEIISKLLTPETCTEEKNTSSENLAVSVSKLKKGLFDVIEQEIIENEIRKDVTNFSTTGIIEKNKSLFEVSDDNNKILSESIKVQKKLIEAPEIVSTEPEKVNTISHDWKYKKKLLQNLQVVHTGDTELIDKSKEIDAEIITKLDEEISLEKYEKNNVSNIEVNSNNVDEHSKTSDQSTEDLLSFKEDIELITKPNIELITKPKQNKKVKQKKKEKKIGKLDLTLLSNLEIKTEMNDDSSSNNIQKEKQSNFVSEIKKKLLNSEFDSMQQKDEDPSLNCVGNSSYIKNKYEKMSKDNQVKLLKAPKKKLQEPPIKPIENITPVKTLKDLKLERENIKWAWKEKDIKDFEEYIKVHDDIAPLKILERQQHLQDCEEELEVMKSLVSDEHALITQIREEKDNEFKEFLAEVEDYLQLDTETVEEDEFKKGIKSYLDLINSEDKTKESKISPPVGLNENASRNEHQVKWKKNSINELHEYINSNKSLAPDNISNRLINAKDHEKVIEKEHERFMIDVHTFLEKPSISSKQESFKEGIHAYLDLIEDNTCTDSSRTGTPKLPKITGPQKISNIKKAMIEKSKSTPTIEKKVGKINNIFEIQQQKKEAKQENKEANALIASGICSSLQNKFEIKKEEETKLFKPNKVTLVKLSTENRETSPLTEIKDEKKYKWTVGASGAFPTDGRPIIENTLNKNEVEIVTKCSIQSPTITPQTKKKNILEKYGIKERPSRSESPSDISDDEKSLFDEEELRSRYGLDRFDQPDSPSPEPRQKSDSVVSFHNLLANLRTARSGKLSESRQRLESESSLGSPSVGPSSPVKSRKVGKLPGSRLRLNSETSVESSSSPVAELVAVPGSCSTIKKIFESGQAFQTRKKSLSPQRKLKNNINIKEGPILDKEPLSPQLRVTGKTNRSEDTIFAQQPSIPRRSQSPKRIGGNNLEDKIFDNSVNTDKMAIKHNKEDFPRGRSLITRAKQCFETKEPNGGSSASMAILSPRLAERSKSVVDFLKPKETCDPFERSVSIENIERSPSFSTFKDAFEKGNSVQNESDESLDNNIIIQKKQVNAELEALKSSSKLKNMFRINKPKKIEFGIEKSASATAVLRDLDEKTINEVTQSKSAIRNMFESKGPKMTFGGNKPPDTPPKNLKLPAPKLPPKPHNERKWVFDTINKYFDVIVEDEKEESSESEYSSAEEELPPIVEPIQMYKVPVNKRSSQPSQTNHPPPQITNSLSQTVATKKISIDELIDESAAAFDSLVVREDDSENDGDTEADSEDDDSDDDESRVDNRRRGNGFGSHISLNQFQVSRSSSSSKIRSLFQSVLHGSNEKDISQFKSNLTKQMSIRSSVENINQDPGVYDESSSEYSEYE